MADNFTSLLLNGISKVASGFYFGRKHMHSKDVGKSLGPSYQDIVSEVFMLTPEAHREGAASFQCDNPSYTTQWFHIK